MAKRLLFPLLALLLLITIHSGRTLSDPPVNFGLWINFGAGTPNFPIGFNITSQTVDDQQRLWIGTYDGGIAMYDGFRWTRYTTADGLLSNQVNNLTAIGPSIWVATTAGVSSFTPASNEWINYTTASGLPVNNVFSVAFRQGFPLSSFLFGTYGGGLAECGLVFPNDLLCDYYTAQNSDLAGDFIHEVVVAANGDRWIAAPPGVNRIQGNTWTTFTSVNTPGCPNIGEATSVAVDNERGRVWFGLAAGTYGIDPVAGQGVCMYDISADTWHHFHKNNSGLADNTVLDVAVDSEGRAWFPTYPFDTIADPTDGGVSVCTWIDDTCYWKTYKTADGLLKNDLRSVGTSLDRVWFGTPDAGLSSFALHWQRFPDEVQALDNLPGRLWVSTSDGLKSFDGTTWTTEIPAVDVRAIMALATNDIWVATFGDGAYHWNGTTWEQFTTANSGLAGDNLLSLTQDTFGRIWLGTNAMGVSVYDPPSNGWATFDAPSVLSANNVRSLAVDAAGQVWVGTSNGLALYSGTDWQTFTTADGLPGNAINGLAVDAMNHVWAATGAGVGEWDGSTWTAYTVANSDLPANLIFTVHATAAGPVWFGTAAGATLYGGTNWKTYRARNSGLTNEHVLAIVSDGEGDLWFGATSYTDGSIPVPGGVFVRSSSTEPLGQPAPVVTDLTPTSGIAGTEVTITGAHFGPDAQVLFGANGNAVGQAAVIQSLTDTTIVAILPPQAVLGPIRVKGSNGAGTSAESFAPLPQITSFSPTSSFVGAPVDIYGMNLDGPGFDKVRFGNSEFNSLIVLSQEYNHVRVLVPKDATNGNIQVKTASGTATSPESFTLVLGGVRVFGWEVQQGLPEYPLVANKSTVVRIFVGSTDPNQCVYITNAALRVLPFGGDIDTYFASIQDGGVPNNGVFCNTEQQFTRDGSIDFYVPGTAVPRNAVHFYASLTAHFIDLRTLDLGNHIFSRTGAWRIHASIPALPGDAMQQALFQGQMTALSRIFPVRDGWGDLGSENGVQVAMTNYGVCDGTAIAYCEGTGPLWDLWQENPNGQLRAVTQKNDNSDATIDGNRLVLPIATIKPNQMLTRKLKVRIRPTALLPLGTEFTTVATLDTADQPGSPDATRSITTNFIRTTAANEANEQPPAPETSVAAQASAAPQLAFTSGFTRWLVDADGSGTITPGDVIEFEFRYTNQGDTDANNVTLIIDYNQNFVTPLGTGGLMMKTGNTFAADLTAGQFYSPPGYTPDKHDRPFDRNYNGVIDTDDLAFYVAEFENWNPATGTFSISTDVSQLDPGEVIRHFRDANRNGIQDPNEATSPHNSDEFKLNHGVVLWDIPYQIMQDFNSTADVQAEYSAFWFLEGINAIMGPGQAEWGGIKSWADLDSTTALAQELAHNLGHVKLTSPNSDGGGHARSDRLPVTVAYDIYSRAVWTGDLTRDVMNAAHPLARGFLAPFEYFDSYQQFRQKGFDQEESRATDEALNGPVFAISGIIEDHEVRITNSYLSDNLPPLPADENGHYRLRFLAGNNVLEEIPFSANTSDYDWYDHQHETANAAADFAIVHPFPAGTTAVEIAHDDGHLLTRLEVSTAPPTVQVVAPNGGQNYGAAAEILIRWNGSDPDGDALKYAIRYSADNGQTWQTLAAAATGDELTVPTNTLPGSTTALIEVSASDGFHTTADRSNNPFTVAPKPPLWASIISPADGDQLLQTQPLVFNGSAFDLEDGTLSGPALTWTSNLDGALGSGETLTKTLSVGQHTITLQAADSDSETVTGRVTIQVLADFDRDGLSDEFEQSQSVLDWWNAADAGQDTDNDGLTNRSEAAWGTDLADADTDGDGISDGDEVAAGSSPNDAQDRPQPPQLLASSTQISIVAPAGGPNPAAAELLLISSTPQELDWTAAESLPWLTLQPTSGTTPATVSIQANVTGLSPGIYVGQIRFSSGTAVRVVPVRLVVTAEGQSPLFLPVVRRP